MVVLLLCYCCVFSAAKVRIFFDIFIHDLAFLIIFNINDSEHPPPGRPFRAEGEGGRGEGTGAQTLKAPIPLVVLVPRDVRDRVAHGPRMRPRHPTRVSRQNDEYLQREPYA